MWSRVKDKILQVNAAVGMEMVFLPGQQVMLNIVAAKNKNNRIIKDWFRQGMNGMDELKDVNRKLPVSLVLNGKGVLTKKLRLQGDENPVLSVFPQGNPAEFYWQVLKSDAYSYVSIARRSLVDQAVASVQEAGFKVLDVSLGFTAIEPLLAFIDRPSFNTSTYFLRTEQGVITEFELQNNQEEYLIWQQYLRSYDLLAFAAATGLLIGNEYCDTETLRMQREELKCQRFFKAGAFSLLVLMFTVLLVNFFVYNYYYERNNQYAVSGHVVNTKGLSSSIKDKEVFLHDQRWLQQPRSSFFADRLAGFLPDGIWLSALHFRNDTILLHGACNDPDRINLLISNIKTLKEVKQVEMKNYAYKKDEDIGAFSIDIITK